MKKLIMTLAALAVSVSFLSAADADKKTAPDTKKGGHNPEELFKKLDTNGDGFLSLDEFKAGPAGKKDAAKAEEIFKRKDTDGDGKLSLAEFSAGHKAAAATTPASGAAPATGGVPVSPLGAPGASSPAGSAPAPAAAAPADAAPAK